MTRRRRPLKHLRIAVLAVLAGAVCIALVVSLRPAPRDDPPGQRGYNAGVLEDLVALSENEPFERPTGSWKLSLPADYGAHPAMRAETWMIAAHLQDTTGAPVGLTFTLSRLGLRAGDPDPNESPWDFRALYRAQVILAESTSGTARAEERFSRGAGAAGDDPQAREVWLDDWQLAYRDGTAAPGLTLTATADGLPIELDLSPVRTATVTDGEDGAPLRGFSIPRLKVTGTIGRGDTKRDLSGVAWLDRLWGDLPTPGGPLGYQRLIAQLENGTDISVLRTARRDGRGVASVEGFVVTADGGIARLPTDGVDMTADPTWTAESGDVAYPVAWRLVGAGLDLNIAPMIENQETGFALPAWSGTVIVSGRQDGVEVAGLGTLQMTGAEMP